MAGKGGLLFKGNKPLTPGQVNDAGRALSDLWRRILPPRNQTPLPAPVPPPGLQIIPQAEPKPADPPDTRTDECTGDCDDKDRCPEKTFCFNKSRFIGTPKETVYDTQLQVQEATMRTMSPTQVLNNRGQYRALKRSGVEALPGVSQAKERVVTSWQMRNPGQDWHSLGYEALHRLDMGAGGEPTGYYDMGDLNVNRSIGGSWPSKTAQLEQHARNLQANGCHLMKVKFDSSPACIADTIPQSYPE